MARLLIANRGEIASRIAQTTKRLGHEVIAIYAKGDQHQRVITQADRAYLLEGEDLAQTYLNIPLLIETALHAEATHVHPGYGFLSENADFAQAVMDAGLGWLGPAPEIIRLMGDKVRAKQTAQSVGLPTLGATLPATEHLKEALEQAQSLGYPLILKPTGGGGGKGMVVVCDEHTLKHHFSSACEVAQKAFGEGKLLLERYLDKARHLEVQIIADQHGNVRHVGERECTLQRRSQKVMEISPAINIGAELRERLYDASIRLARAVNYTQLGTVEFLLDEKGQEYFIEMNTRIQVEHPVTEACFGIDLVEWQWRIAHGETLPTQDQWIPKGVAIQARICAETPDRQSLPTTGNIDILSWPLHERVDHNCQIHTSVGLDYDSLLAKLIVHRTTHEQALHAMQAALQQVWIWPLITNVPYLLQLTAHSGWSDGYWHTRLLDSWPAEEPVPIPQFIALALAAYYHSASKDWGWQLHGDEQLLTLHFPTESIRLHVTTQDNHWQCRWQDGEATLDSLHTTDIQPYQHHQLQLDGEPMSGWSAWQDEGLVLCYRGKNLYCAKELLPPAASTHHAPQGHCAQMPGKIVALHAQPGDHVTVGQAILTLEAMKMQQTLHSTQEGQLQCDYQVGEVVEAGKALFDVS